MEQLLKRVADENIILWCLVPVSPSHSWAIRDAHTHRFGTGGVGKSCLTGTTTDQASRASTLTHPSPVCAKCVDRKLRPHHRGFVPEAD